MKVRVIALVIFLLSALLVHAQTIRLRGTVLDPSGAVIPEADLKVTQGSSIVAEGKTDATGAFSLDMPAGDYRLEVSRDGFRPRQQNVRVAANMRPRKQEVPA